MTSSFGHNIGNAFNTILFEEIIGPDINEL